MKKDNNEVINRLITEQSKKLQVTETDLLS